MKHLSWSRSLVVMNGHRRGFQFFSLVLRTRGRQLKLLGWIATVILFSSTLWSLPKLTFRSQQKFKQSFKFEFSNSSNHLVSKETMREKVIEIENHSVRMCFTNGWEHDSKSLISWDSYYRHRDVDFVSFMKCAFQHIIFLIIPANFTETCQPLDRYFNALIK